MKILCKNADEREKQLKTGTEILIKEWNKDAEKLEIFVEFQEEDELFVKHNGNKIHIVCKEPAHYYRNLTQIFCNGEVYENKEKVFFEKNGVMLDCSRNAVGRSHVGGPGPAAPHIPVGHIPEVHGQGVVAHRRVGARRLVPQPAGDRSARAAAAPGRLFLSRPDRDRRLRQLDSPGAPEAPGRNPCPRRLRRASPGAPEARLSARR